MASADVRAIKLALPRVYLIGAMRIIGAHREEILPRSRKARALFACLCLARGERVSRNRLAGLLWDRSPEVQAKTSLRHALSELKREVEKHASRLIEADREGVRLNMKACWIDALALLDASVGAPAADNSELLRACSDRLLEDLDGISPAFDQWLASERARFGDSLRRLLETDLDRTVRRNGRPAERVAAARRLIGFEPTHEGAVRVLMTALVETDDRAQAIREYERCREALRSLLDMTPSKETTALYEAVRRFSPGRAATAQVTSPRDNIASTGAGSGDRAAADPPDSQQASATTSPAEQPVIVTTGYAALSNGRPSIAVLPLQNLTPNATDDYLGDGIVEDIIEMLSRVPNFFVISRLSTLTLKNQARHPREIGRLLGVRYVLSGSIRRADDRIRVSAELADSESQTVLWTDRFDGGVGDIFTVQDRLSQRVAITIAPFLHNAELQRIARKRPENFNAYDFMLRGLDLLYRLRREEFELAREMLARSIELDPSYAAPVAYTALWHSIRIGQGWSTDLTDDRTAVDRLASMALEIDSLDATALALCGHVKALLFRDHGTALTLFDRALKANPNSSIAWVRSSPTFSYLGNGDEARRRGEHGLRLSPFDPHAFFIYGILGLACYTSGDYEAAVAWGRRSLAENPDWTANLRVLAASLAAAGHETEARQVGAALRQAEPKFRVRQFCETYAYKDPARRDLLAHYLVAAGLVE
jgi:TolB-like protein/DNA-binding SARP family transcriptional activator